MCAYGRVWVCLAASTRSWMLIFIYKGAYCNFSLWGFYDTVWQCFLAKLVAARHVLYYSPELCAHSWFLVSKMIIWRELFLQRLLLDCDWFHSNPNKQNPTKRIYFGLCYDVWAAGFLTASGLTVWISPSAHKYCLEIMQFQGPHTPWANIHNLTQQYLTLPGRIWHIEAWNPLTYFVQNNNHMNVCNSEYLFPTMKLLLKKTTFYIAFGTEEGA